jgi:hypothetical protein
MHPALKRGTKNFHYTSKTCGILVISIFYETKIRTVDMKVHEYSKFRKNKISKKVKSINSMENGRFDTSKYRGKLEKMGVLCTHSPKSPGPFPKLPIKKLKKINNFQKKGTRLTLSRCRPVAATGSTPGQGWLAPFLWKVLFSCPPLIAQVVNSCWLVSAHGRPA